MESITIRHHTLRAPKLTRDQNRALVAMVDFMHGGGIMHGAGIMHGGSTQAPLFMLLEGSAGTGKTFLMQLLVKYNNMLGSSRKILMGSALTHKARKVLHRSLNYEGSSAQIPTKTIASLLKKQRLNSYLGTKKYGAGGDGMEGIDLLIIDEASMIDDRDLQQLVARARKHRTKILFVGDSAQIPHPTQKLEFVAISEDDVAGSKLLIKADSAAFRLRNRIQLNEIVRQKVGNPLLDVARHIRENLYCSEVTGPYEHRDAVTGSDLGVRFVDPISFEDLVLKDFLDWDKWRSPHEARIITYTNQSVRAYNRLARNARFAGNQRALDLPFAQGDLLMGYNNIGWPTPYIENGQDYIVTRVRRDDRHPVSLDGGVQVKSPGYLVTFGEASHGNVGSKEAVVGTNTTQFFPIPDDDRNLPLLMELRKRAQKVNRPNSGGKVYKHYRELKDQLLFMESLYEFKGKIWAESDFKREHPLLSTKVIELIHEKENTDTVGQRSIRADTKLYKQIAALYPKVIEERALSRHMLGPNEEFGDRYLVIDKDMDYGYAVTAHKSQGSTYDRVYVDDVDLSKIRDRWNYEHNTYYRASKERNQLKYVALTRARNLATILSNQVAVPESQSDDESDTDLGPEFLR